LPPGSDDVIENPLNLRQLCRHQQKTQIQSFSIFLIETANFPHL